MHLVHLSKSRASVDLQKRQMERESEWRRKQRQTAGNRKETGETRRGEGRTDGRRRTDTREKKKGERQLDNERENYRDVQTLITKCLFQGAF